MKKLIPFLVFAAAFVGTYFALSFGIPGWRIKLEAAPAVVFVETLKIIWPVKVPIALAVSALAGGMSYALCKRKS